MPKERRFSAPLGPDYSNGDEEEGSDDVAVGVSGVRGVEGWWLARGEAKGSAAGVAVEKIKGEETCSFDQLRWNFKGLRLDDFNLLHCIFREMRFATSTRSTAISGRW
ncbi:uncharacterized protein [Gossypium hirsutum]|uniref:Uncharacterized protein n=1 Tax=Gossypium hirsutum TaxID=3635 RepID=A0ABM2ZFI9_GOSHI|nr:uncharacterized protein LOC107935129 [Gossypium hirsutum]